MSLRYSHSDPDQMVGQNLGVYAEDTTSGNWLPSCSPVSLHWCFLWIFPEYCCFYQKVSFIFEDLLRWTSGTIWGGPKGHVQANLLIGCRLSCLSLLGRTLEWGQDDLIHLAELWIHLWIHTRPNITVAIYHTCYLRHTLRMIHQIMCLV